MWTILADLFGGLISALAGVWAKRKASTDAARAATNQAQAEAHSAQIGDQADVAVEHAREQNDDAITRATADGARPDGLRLQSADVQSAIDQANCELPRT